MKHSFSRKTALALSLPIVVLILLAGFRTTVTEPHPLEPISQHYKHLSKLDSQVRPHHAWMDTVSYPWSEYGKGAIDNSLWRTVYLSQEEEAKLAHLIRVPANSSDQTRAELDYMLELQKVRTSAEIKKAEYIANIGSWPNI